MLEMKVGYFLVWSKYVGKFRKKLLCFLLRHCDVFFLRYNYVTYPFVATEQRNSNDVTITFFVVRLYNVFSL